MQAAVRGFQMQCEKADKGVRPLHRPREFDSHSRWRKKCLTRYTWYRPHNSVLFVPCTPNGNLAREIQKVVSEETSRLSLTAKVIEKGGISMKSRLVKMDLTGCPYNDCYLCESGIKGASHTRAGIHYSSTCTLCKNVGVSARYEGETGRNGYWRSTLFHKKDILKNDVKNAFSKHLSIHHPDHLKDPSVFKLRVESTHSKCLDRQVKEGITIKNSKADIKMNSKAEYHQPSVRRVIII